jgi:AhpD family alkylhydroperoxidase
MDRINYQKQTPEAVHALMGLSKVVSEFSIGHGLQHLIEIRASQLNGCAFCVDMHSKQAKLSGERELRLYHLPIWRESNLFNDRERAALEWTELLTRIGHAGVEDEQYEAVKKHFNEKEIVELTMVVLTINAWNRLGVAFRSTPGAMDKLFGLDKAGLT